MSKQFETNDFGGWIVPDHAVIPDHTIVPADSEIGRWCKIGRWCELGDGCKLGYGCELEGVSVTAWLTLGNVDGTGRQVLLIWHEDGVLVRAGCFLGSVDEFYTKAETEGKCRYVRVIRAVADAGAPQ